MPSAVIRRYAWRPATAGAEPALDIEFTTGRVYRYHGVPEELVREMRCWMSKGAFFNRHIRDRFACERLRGGWPEEGAPELV